MNGHQLLVMFLAVGALASAQLPDGARYLIIAPDDMLAAVRPLADWKTQQGLPAKVVPLRIAGTTPQAVRSYIRNAWNTWPVRPEFVLIACSPNQLPGYLLDDDSYYGDMTGDYLMEVAVGRMPAWDSPELELMVAKTLAYERTPETIDTAWYRKGTTVISDGDSSRPDPYYVTDSRHARELWLAAGYTRAESLYNLTGDTTQQLIDALNDGRTFITYRGIAGGFWWQPFTIWPNYLWVNRRRMPMIISATCETVTLRPGEWMFGDLCMRFGTVQNLGGTVAFFGTSKSGYAISAQRSAVYRGFFDAVFDQGIHTIGTAALKAKLRVDSLFRDRDRYVEWCLLGDPALNVWTSVPRRATVVHDTVVSTTDPYLHVSVSVAGTPVPGARICAWMDSTIYQTALTDSAGNAVIPLVVPLPGSLLVTVTGPNLRPYEGTCRIALGAGPFVVHLRHAIADPAPGGNEDSSAAPGETVFLPTWVRNHGDSSAVSVSAALSTADTLVTILDSLYDFGTLGPGDSAWSGDASFRVVVSPSCPVGHTARFTLRCTAGSHTWNSFLSVPIGTPGLEISDTSYTEVQGNGNGRLDPNETGRLSVSLYNYGFGTAMNVHGIFRSYDPRLVVEESTAFFGTIRGTAGASNDSSPFRFRCLDMMPETRIACSLFVTAAGHAWQFYGEVQVGLMQSRDPLPDGPRIPPLYWSYEEIDTAWAEHPAYDWVELRGTGTRLNLGDNTTLSFALPGWFGGLRYYGRRYDSVSVNANGWLAPGVTSFTGYSNRALPWPTGTPMLAVNWDDLYPAAGGGILYRFDSSAHRLVVEWDSVHYRSPSDRFDKFQAVIYDSTLAAGDGNNEIVFQYYSNRNMRRSAVAMQDPTGAIGMTLLNDSVYHRAAAYIRPGRAIKLTTDPPMVGIAEGRPLPASPSPVVSLLPNPSAGMVRLEGNILPGATITVSDVLGRVVFRQSAIGNPEPEMALDLRGLRPGVYIARLSTPASSVTTKLVIQR